MPVTGRFCVESVSAIEYILCLALTAVPPLPAQPPVGPSNPNCSVKGTVTNAATGERLRKAYVRLEPATGKGTTYPGVTDNNGVFVLPNVTAGAYHLMAEKQGFLDGRYGGMAANVVLTLSPGEDLSEADIALISQAVVSGRVLDEDGDPWTHAVVSIYRAGWKNGKRELEGFNSQDADDQGNFRIAALPPGRYYVVALPDAGWENRNRAASSPRHQPTWYPNASDTLAATAVALTAGEERGGTEIRLRESPFFHIRGKLNGLNRIPPANETEPFSRAHLSARRVSATVNGDASYGGVLRPDGSFDIAAVPSGTYEIWVARGFPSIATLGRTIVQVHDQDVDDVSIDLVPPHPLKGIIQIEGDDRFDTTGLLVNLDSIDGPSGPFPATVRKDGSFDFAQISAERLHVRLTGSGSERLYLKTLRYGDTESRDGVFSAATEQVLVLVASTRGARLTGIVKNSDHPGARPKVVLIPDSGQAEYDTRMGVFDQRGAFAIDAIAPGEYHLYAFEDVPDGSWLHPDLRAQIQAKGIALYFEEGDRKSVEVPMIGRSELDGLLARLGIE